MQKLGSPPRIHVHGGFSRTLTGEIGLSEIQNVFAEVSICPERIKLLRKSLRGTHFEATVTRFEYSVKFYEIQQEIKVNLQFSWRGKWGKGPPWASGGISWRGKWGSGSSEMGNLCS